MLGDAAGHVPVLAGPALEWLGIRQDGIYVDCTAGAGGHAARIAAQLTNGRLIALDRDPQAVARVAERLEEYPFATVLHRNYGSLAEVLAEIGIVQVDGILIDAGLSSVQLDDPTRGFSFQEDGPLDMRMDPSSGESAAEYLNRVPPRELADALKRYGDVRPAKRIAQAMIRRREAGRLNGTRDVAAAVAEALDFVHGVPEETRTVFQALRIVVNEELRWLEAGLRQGVAALKTGGRLVAISFHSGEDRVVKQVMRELSRKQRLLHPDGRSRAEVPPVVRLLTAKPLFPSSKEIQRNPRAKSAKLRAVERLPANGD